MKSSVFLRRRLLSRDCDPRCPLANLLTNDLIDLHWKLKLRRTLPYHTLISKNEEIQQMRANFNPKFDDLWSYCGRLRNRWLIWSVTYFKPIKKSKLFYKYRRPRSQDWKRRSWWWDWQVPSTSSNISDWLSSYFCMITSYYSNQNIKLWCVKWGSNFKWVFFKFLDY